MASIDSPNLGKNFPKHKYSPVASYEPQAFGSLVHFLYSSSFLRVLPIMLN